MDTIQANRPWKPILLPPDSELKSMRILKKLPAAHRTLAELKGISSTMPNQTIMLNTLLWFNYFQDNKIQPPSAGTAGIHGFPTS